MVSSTKFALSTEHNTFLSHNVTLKKHNYHTPKNGKSARRIHVNNILYILLGMQTWQFLWIRDVLQKGVGTAIVVVTAA